MNFLESDDTKVFALGGLGEVGKNMYCIMHGNEIVITDAGVIFPAGELMGIDYVIPDFTFSKILLLTDPKRNFDKCFLVLIPVTTKSISFLLEKFMISCEGTPLKISLSFTSKPFSIKDFSKLLRSNREACSCFFSISKIQVESTLPSKNK